MSRHFCVRFALWRDRFRFAGTIGENIALNKFAANAVGLVPTASRKALL